MGRTLLTQVSIFADERSTILWYHYAPYDRVILWLV